MKRTKFKYVFGITALLFSSVELSSCSDDKVTINFNQFEPTYDPEIYEYLMEGYEIIALDYKVRDKYSYTIDRKDLNITYIENLYETEVPFKPYHQIFSGYLSHSSLYTKMSCGQFGGKLTNEFDFDTVGEEFNLYFYVIG